MGGGRGEWGGVAVAYSTCVGYIIHRHPRSVDGVEKASSGSKTGHCTVARFASTRIITRGSTHATTTHSIRATTTSSSSHRQPRWSGQLAHANQTSATRHTSPSLAGRPQRTTRQQRPRSMASPPVRRTTPRQCTSTITRRPSTGAPPTRPPSVPSPPPTTPIPPTPSLPHLSPIYPSLITTSAPTTSYIIPTLSLHPPTMPAHPPSSVHPSHLPSYPQNQKIHQMPHSRPSPTLVLRLPRLIRHRYTAPTLPRRMAPHPVPLMTCPVWA